MKHYCHYHPISPAKWHCRACHCYFDNACVPSSDEKKRLASCPHCSKAMEYFRDKPVESPFWQNSSTFLALPFKVELLLTLLLLTLASVFLALYPSLMLLGSILAVLVVTQISMSVLRQTSEDPKQPITLSHILQAKDFSSNVFVGLAVIIAGGVTAALGDWLGIGWAVFSGCVFTYALPSWILAFSSSKDFKASFTPENLLRPILQMEKAYFGVVAYIAGAILSTLIVADFLDQHAPAHFFAPIVFGLSIYFALCLSAMLGYVLAEYDGFRVVQGQLASEIEEITGEVTLSFDANLDIHLKQGRYLEALNLLEVELKRNPDSEYRRNQFLKLCLALDDMERVERYIHAVMRMLLDRNQIKFAKSILMRLREADETFKLHDLSLSLGLAKCFQKQKDDEMVLWLADEAHTRFDKDEELAELFLLAAKTLVAKMKNASKAAFFLRYIIQNFPEHEVSASAQILQAHVDKYSATV